MISCGDNIHANRNFTVDFDVITYFILKLDHKKLQIEFRSLRNLEKIVLKHYDVWIIGTVVISFLSLVLENPS